jgi:hypothetical protein
MMCIKHIRRKDLGSFQRKQSCCMTTIGKEIMSNSSYNPVLGSNDFLLFGPMKVHVRGQIFETED